MRELPAFAVVKCPACCFDSLVARDLDDADEWVYSCTRCEAPLDEATLSRARSYDPDGLTVLGYVIDNGKAAKKKGCGSGCGCKTAG